MPDLISGGLRLHYVAAPHAPRNPAIVFLHGAGSNHTIWLGQIKVLRESAWVVLPDLPGHGKSEAIPGRSIEEYARALVPFLETVRARAGQAAGTAGSEAGRLVLAGHSMGGAIALCVALDRPDLLAGLVLLGTGARLRVSPDILQGLRDAPLETQGLVARWQFTKNADPAMIVRTVRELAGLPLERTLADFEACNAFDARERLGEIAAPALAIVGREDLMTPVRYSEMLRDRMPRVSLRVVENAGHAVMVEGEKEVSVAIESFLREIPA